MSSFTALLLVLLAWYHGLNGRLITFVVLLFTGCSHL